MKKIYFFILNKNEKIQIFFFRDLLIKNMNKKFAYSFLIIETISSRRNYFIFNYVHFTLKKISKDSVGKF